MLNTVTVMGRLVERPEIVEIQEGEIAALFSVACERDYANREGKKKIDYIDCIAFRKTANFVKKYFKRGDLATIEGKLQASVWKQKDGTMKKTHEVRVITIYYYSNGSTLHFEERVPKIAIENRKELDMLEIVPKYKQYIELENGEIIELPLEVEEI